MSEQERLVRAAKQSLDEAKKFARDGQRLLARNAALHAAQALDLSIAEDGRDAGISSTVTQARIVEIRAKYRSLR